MGKAGRFACIFVPMALTLASLACLTIIMLGNTNKGSTFLSDVYFMKADTRNFTGNPNVDIIKGTDLDDKLVAMFQKIAASHELKDFYTVGLWNYCEGTSNANNSHTGGTSNYDPSHEKITFCSAHQSSFWFNPVDVWGLNDTAVEQYIPKKLNDGLKVYSKVVKFMFTVYIVAIATTAAEVLIGFLAIFSRWGSCVTSILSGATTLFTFLASLSATIIYSTFMGTFNTVLEPYHIKASLGQRMLVITWLAFAFSLGAGLFWTISTCCCSGRNNDRHSKRGGVTAEKAPYTYERVASPYGHHGGDHSSQMPLRDMGAPPAGAYQHQQPGREGAYEPFRHV